jgi:hypothetical protein
MGRQVNFFLTEKDKLSILQLLGVKLEIAAIRDPSDSLPAKMHKPEYFGQPTEEFFKIFLFQPHDYKQLTFYDAAGRGDTYYIDEANCPVIEFWPSRTRQKKIVSGRFWYEASYLAADGQCYMKSDEFLEFAKLVFVITKKFCARVGKGQDLKYLGPDALEMTKHGYELVEH